MLSLKLLGGASVERAGSPLPGRAARGHRLALLAVLALSGGRPLSRDKLLALLWPELDTDRARRSLSDTIYLLRGAFGDEVVTTSGDDLRLDSSRVASDVAEFERLLDEGRPEAAVRVYAGPFLDGFHLTESVEFEAWADRERSRLAERHASALEALAESAESAGDWGRAVSWWRRRAAAEPGNGRIALRLMRALDAAGDRAGALQHARVHERLLREEFGAPPHADVLRLAEELRQAPAPASPPPALVPAAAVSEPPTIAEQPAVPEPLPPVINEPLPPVAATGHTLRAWIAAAALVVLAAAAVFVIRAKEPPRAEPTVARTSIAVLPFANLSADPAKDYFSDGLAEELIGVLGRIEGLRVAARTSSFALAGRGLDVRTIGDTLDVATVLEGSVRRDGSRIRIGARLVDAASGYQIWSEEYHRELRDIFAVQDEIASAIAGALEMKLAGGPGGPARRRSPSVEAHDLYLRGVFVRNQLTAEGLGRAVDYFDRAIQIDSGYALAYAGKASAIAPLVWYGHLPRAQGLPAMRAASRRALELDPDLGEAHVAQGMFEFYFEWNWPAAEREFQRAVALNPSDPHAHHMYANYLTAMGRMDEALAERSRALALDPLSIRSGILLGRDYLIAGRYEDAIEQFRRMIEIDSTSPLALGTGQEGTFGLGDVYDRQGRDAEAFAEYLRGARLEGMRPAQLVALRQAFESGGLRGYWRRRLALELEDTASPPEPLRVASMWARIGDADQAARWVQRAYEARSMALPFLGVMPPYDGVRAHPGIAAVLRRMRLTEAAERIGRLRRPRSAGAA
jgi:TolB-like protein/DNA-binding SARP family transcriptional activator/tetratricopeptide (TPR) repeat protein